MTERHGGVPNDGTLAVVRQRLRLGVTAKLFLALLTLVILAVVASSIAARLAFLSSFLGYLNQRELERIQSMLPELAERYQEHHSWAFLREDPEAWFEVVSRIENDQAFPEDVSTSSLTFQAPPLRVADPTGLGLRVALLDAQQEYVVGIPSVGSDVLLQPIALDHHVVGWLAVVPFQRLTAGAADRLQRRQLISTWLIGAAAVVLSALVAIVLTQRLLRPVRRIAQATHRLAAGDFATRLEVLSTDEIGQLARDFNRLALVLEKNEQARRAFMADVSHELRTPLAVMRAELEAVEDEVRVLTPQTVRSLQGEVSVLGKLVNDLYELSLADVGALTYRMSEVNITTLLRDRLAAFHERLAQRHVTVETEIPEASVSLTGDETRLQQLFTNLLENSVRYTDAYGRLVVLCRVIAGAVVIDFQDSAPGVAADLIPHLFERFFRVDVSRSRTSGGAGLGLSLCKSIVEAHGGSIAARPSSLGGLWISITLPVLKSPL